MGNYIFSADYYAFHPGYYLKEMMDDAGMNLEDFSSCLKIASQDLDKLIKGELNISGELAGRLSLALGTSRELWLNLQKTYDKKNTGCR